MGKSTSEAWALSQGLVHLLIVILTLKKRIRSEVLLSWITTSCVCFTSGCLVLVYFNQTVSPSVLVAIFLLVVLVCLFL